MKPVLICSLRERVWEVYGVYERKDANMFRFLGMPLPYANSTSRNFFCSIPLKDLKTEQNDDGCRFVLQVRWVLPFNAGHQCVSFS
jgi:hypothetical protein